MNRRNFLKSAGGAIAALMLPFGVKVKLSAPSKPKAALVGFWYQTTRQTMCYDERYLEYLNLLLKAQKHASSYGDSPHG